MFLSYKGIALLLAYTCLRPLSMSTNKTRPNTAIAKPHFGHQFFYYSVRWSALEKGFKMLWFRYHGIFVLVACLEMSESCCKGKEALPLAAGFSKSSSFPSWWRREQFGGNPCSIHRDIWLSCWGNYQNTQKMGVSIKSTFASKGQQSQESIL